MVGYQQKQQDNEKNRTAVLFMQTVHPQELFEFKFDSFVHMTIRIDTFKLDSFGAWIAIAHEQRGLCVRSVSWAIRLRSRK